mmetsp:Transcript_15503/g.39258  ORF Transcript_15503/g.39258 Transcript_15503/m.39258 type:complete len:436 (+) Transcript_15503:10-1317(+)
MGESKKWVDFAAKHLCPGVGRISDFVFARGSGSRLFTPEGKAILDFTAGIGVTNTGHCHPTVVEAVRQQAGTITHAQVNLGLNEPLLKLTERLLGFVPQSLSRFFFWNSGAEAVEAAVKVARMHTRRPGVVSFQGGYHGRTFMTMSMTSSKHVYSAGFGPLMSNTYTAPFPYCHRCPSRTLPTCDIEQGCCGLAADQFDDFFKQNVAPQDVAAIVIEPLQGEGGFVLPPKSFMEKVRSFCSQHGIVFVVDEVQSGFGRTGSMFCIDGHFNVEPDILVSAKGLASGYPLSMIVSKPEFMEGMTPGSMGGTYAGNAVSCAAALATLDVFEQENVLGNVHERSKQAFLRLAKMKEESNGRIADIRGLGLMIGIELNDKLVNPGSAARVVKEAGQRELLLLNTGAYECLRLLPPLTVTEEEMEEGLDKFEGAVKAALEY